MRNSQGLLFGGTSPIRGTKLFLLHLRVHSRSLFVWCLVFVFLFFYFSFTLLCEVLSYTEARQSGSSQFHSPSLWSGSCHKDSANHITFLMG